MGIGRMSDKDGFINVFLLFFLFLSPEVHLHAALARQHISPDNADDIPLPPARDFHSCRQFV